MNVENTRRPLSKMLGHDSALIEGTLCQVLRHDRADRLRSLSPMLGTDRSAYGMYP